MQAFTDYVNENMIIDKLIDQSLDTVIQSTDYLQDILTTVETSYSDLKSEITAHIEDIDLEEIRSEVKTYLGNKLAFNYSVIQEEVFVGDYHCWGSDNAQVWRPDSNGKFPLISFAHGLFDGGDDIHEYDSMLTDLASHGYVILGTKAASNLYCNEETLDQIRTIEWAKSDPTYSEIIDFTKKVGLLGHSMGGEATHRTSGNIDAVAEMNIGAAVAISPVYWHIKSQVPIFFGAGSHDVIVLAETVKWAYDQSKSTVSAVYGNITGANHYECSSGENRWAPYTASFFNCHLLEIDTDCANIYGSSSNETCSLCNCEEEIPMSRCEFNSKNFN